MHLNVLIQKLLTHFLALSVACEVGRRDGASQSFYLHDIDLSTSGDKVV